MIRAMKVQKLAVTRRERVFWCHSLAAGANDPKFAAALRALAEEYDDRLDKTDLAKIDSQQLRVPGFEMGEA